MPYKDPEAKRKRHTEYMRDRYRNDPVHRAKQIARVKTGKLKEKPQTCERCGGESPEAHHEDYSQPHHRIWLCRPCHRKEHPGEC